jgi:two-component system aerobic respiration control sensor histidine kinase ArcB
MLVLVSQSAKEFLDLLNHIIEFSRNEIDRQAILEKKFDFKEIIQKAITMEQAAAIAKELELTFEYPEIATIYLGDPYRIQRIILNLLSNAITFTQKGKVGVAVQLAKELNEHQVILKLIVSDTGIGIPKEKQRYIYEKFYRVHPANQNTYIGAGLGLHVVKQMVNDLHGEIDVISVPDKGTTFTCTLLLSKPLINEIINNETY